VSEFIVIANRFWLFPTFRQKRRFVSHLVFRYNFNKRTQIATELLNQNLVTKEPFQAQFINR